MSNSEHVGNAIRWQGVADCLAGEIEAGIFKPGGRLANERELTERYAVHRHTLRQAVADLARRGLLEIRRGPGTFVQDPPISYRIGATSRFRRNINELSRERGGRLLSSATLVAPPHIAIQLALPPGAIALRLDILREVDGVPLISSEHWFPADRVPDIGTIFEQSQSITLAFDMLGIRGLRRQENRIVTRMPTPKEAALLRQSPNSPVLIWESLKVDEASQPIDFGISVVAGERVQLIFGPS